MTTEQQPQNTQPINTDKHIPFYKKLDNYRLSVFAAIIASIFLLLYLILFASITGNIDFIFTGIDNWFFNFIFIPALFSRLVSGNTYFFGRGADFLTIKRKQKEAAEASSATTARDDYTVKNPYYEVIADRKVGTWEKALTILGSLVGIAVATLIIVYNNSVPLWSPLNFVANIIFVFGNISMFAGLGDRFGFYLDNNNYRPKNERKGMFYAIVVGIAAGLILVLVDALFSANITSILYISGVSALLSAGLALPYLLGAIVFVLTLSSLCTSCTDYVIRTFNFFCRWNDEQVTITHRFHEYRGAATGTISGLIIAIGITIGIALTANPITAIIVFPVIILSCIAILGSICSRVGRVIDKYKLITQDEERGKKLNQV